MKLSKRARHALETIRDKSQEATGKLWPDWAFVEPCEYDGSTATLRSLVRNGLIDAMQEGRGPLLMKVGQAFSWRENYFCRLTKKGKAALNLGRGGSLGCTCRVCNAHKYNAELYRDPSDYTCLYADRGGKAN